MPVRILLSFKDQRSAYSVRRQLGELSRKIGTDIRPVHTAERSDWRSNQKKRNPPSLISNALCIIFSAICAIQIMSDIHANTFINVLRNTGDLQSGVTSKMQMQIMQIMSDIHANTFINVLRNTRDLRSGVTPKSNMGEPQVIYTVISRS